MAHGAVDSNKLHAFLGKVVGDVGAACNLALVLVGEQLGLYRALAHGGPMTAAQLASATGASERCVTEWLAAQAASGYAGYDAGSGTFFMEPEQAAVFADEDSPVFLAPVAEVVAALYRDEPRITAAFSNGQGLGWNERNPCLFRGTARFFRTAYRAHLVQEWLPALEGMVARLEAGALVADIGCGHGVPTLLMARAFPRSRFRGFDYHAASVEQARRAAREEGLDDRVSFEISTAGALPAGPYALACFFDCLHDMGDPVAALRQARAVLTADGTCMLVEPLAGDRLEDNLNPVGRLFYAVSSLICTPAAMAQSGGETLGAQAGEERLRKLAREAEFRHFRRAAQTPFHMVLEARA